MTSRSVLSHTTLFFFVKSWVVFHGVHVPAFICLSTDGNHDAVTWMLWMYTVNMDVQETLGQTDVQSFRQIPKWEVIALYNDFSPSIYLFIMSSRGQRTTIRVLFSLRVVPGARSQVIRLDSKGPHPLSHFASPWSNSIFSFLGDFLKIFTVAVLIHWELCCCLRAWLVLWGVKITCR